MAATLTVTSSWSLPIAKPTTTATSLYPLGTISEAQPPLVLTTFPDSTPYPDNGGDWTVMLNHAITAGYDRILIDASAGMRAGWA